jgi:hypothetical protein
MYDIEGLKRTAFHEACHTLLAHSYGWTIESVSSFAAGDGCAAIALPFQPLELPSQFRVAPLRTRQELIQLLSVITAPAVVLSVPHSAGDQGDLWVWQYVWSRCRYASSVGHEWKTIYDEAETAVERWLERPGTTDQLVCVAQALEHRRFLSGEDFKALLAQPQPARPASVMQQSTPAPALPSRPPPLVSTKALAAPQPQQQSQRQPLSLEDMVWLYSQYVGSHRGVPRLPYFTPRRGIGYPLTF